MVLYQAIYNDNKGDPCEWEPRQTEGEAISDLTALGFNTAKLIRHKGLLVSFEEPCSIAIIRA